MSSVVSHNLYLHVLLFDYYCHADCDSKTGLNYGNSDALYLFTKRPPEYGAQ